MKRTRSTLICGLSALALLAAIPAVSQGAPAQPDAAPVQPQPTDPTHVRRVAAAEDLASLHAQLEMQGYTDIVVRRTLLGRYRVQAENALHVRELVIHPRTGEILRDVLLEIKGTAGAAVAGSGNPTPAGDAAAPAATAAATANVAVDAGVSGNGGLGVDPGRGDEGDSAATGGGGAEVSAGGGAEVSVGGAVGGALGLGN